MNESTKENLIHLLIVVLLVFLVSYLAFYVALKYHLGKLNSPFYQVNQMEKVLEKQELALDRFNEKTMNNPFEPRMRPMIVNLVKEAHEYKVIVDLAQLDNNEDAIEVVIDNNEVTIKGEIDKKIRGTERIVKFTQTYYLDEKIQEDEISKERKGNKYIINLPFKAEKIENEG